jgi:hypothetical protein
MRRYLVVANQTLGGEQLSAKLAECMQAGPCRFYLVAPVTNTEASDRWFTGGLEGVLPGAYRIARSLAGAACSTSSTASGRPAPTPTMDLPHRIRRATKLPVTQVTGPAGPSL